MKTRWIRSLIVAAMLLLLVPITSAQDEPPTDTPLLRILSAVPAGLARAEGFVSYIDFRASEAGREGTGRYANVEQLVADESDAASLWINALPSSGPGDLMQNIFRGSDMQEVMGFDLFDIDQALEFGMPPTNGVMLAGDFEAGTIIAAHIARDFTVESTIESPEGLTLLCGPDGCDSGQQTNIENRYPSNPFGGNLGRSQPTLIITSEDDHDLVMSSGPLDVVDAMADSVYGERQSLADNRTYRAAAEVLAGRDLLRGAYFISPMEVYFLPDMPNVLGGMGEDQDVTELDLPHLPGYMLLVFADIANEDTQHAVVGLVYTNIEDAEAAVEAVPARLDVAVSLRVARPMQDLFDERGMVLNEPEIIENETTGRFVVLFDFEYPQVTNEPNNSGLITQSGLGFRLFMNMLFARDLAWLRD